MATTKKFGWCFIGSGSITKRVMQDLSRYAEISTLVAVYSPHEDHALALAQPYGAKVYRSAKEAIEDPAVDGVYIAIPHQAHAVCAEEALRLGKPVLCEKPMSPNLAQTAHMAALAREKKLYLAEAMWTRYNPVIRRIRTWIQDGKIGKVHCVEGDFGYYAAWNPKSRIFAPALAGGGLLDVGVYPLSLAQAIYGDQMPSSITAVGNLTPDGVDGDCGVLLKYPDGGIAMLFTSLQSHTPSMAKICGEKGVIVIESPFWKPRKANCYCDSGNEVFQIEVGDYEGFHFEFDEVAREIQAGCLESRQISLQASCHVAQITDEIRRQLGVVYPFE